ncbi:hypothetical protein LZ31DRAFT_564645 [Colletotrichum somersetense]|nr:hypothetical protein LZ31DRAFT_564645 [Colletotrichum somersetense]
MNFFTKKAPEEHVTADPATSTVYDEKTGEHPGEGFRDEEPIGKDVQAGVAKVEAMTAPNNMDSIWLFYVVTSIQEVTMRVLSPFVTSTFAVHSLTATTGVMSTLIAGLINLPLAKILDTWGRPQGLGLMLLYWVIGFIMMAVGKNVETYAAAQVFYTVGILSKGGMGWRWGLGIWATIGPAVLGPLVILFLWNQHKAKKTGIIESRGSIKNISASKVLKFLIDIDAIGILILAAGMALFLLPFNIYSYQSEGWKSPLIISFIIVGFFLIIGFVFYEKYLAPVTFIPFALLMDRTVLFSGVMFIFLFFSNAIWGPFFSSMLLAVWDVSVAQATYIGNIYRTGSCLAAIPFSALSYKTGRFKPWALYFLIPLMILGVGLMVHFRQSDQSIGYIVMTQIFIAVAGGTIVVCGEMAMLAPSDHQHIAVILAALDLFGSIGSTIGYTVVTAIWTGTFRKNITKYTPPGTPVDLIYNNIYSQLSYPMSSPERIGIQRAYGDS